jgi:hypothetical protein
VTLKDALKLPGKVAEKVLTSPPVALTVALTFFAVLLVTISVLGPMPEEEKKEP